MKPFFLALCTIIFSICFFSCADDVPMEGKQKALKYSIVDNSRFRVESYKTEVGCCTERISIIHDKLTGCSMYRIKPQNTIMIPNTCKPKEEWK